MYICTMENLVLENYINLYMENLIEQKILILENLDCMYRWKISSTYNGKFHVYIDGKIHMENFKNYLDILIEWSYYFIIASKSHTHIAQEAIMNEQNIQAYKDYLNQEIERAAHRFDEAKAKAIRELENMTVWTATEYGAGYASHIDEVTRWAAEVQKLSQAYRVFENAERNAYQKITIGSEEN